MGTLSSSPSSKRRAKHALFWTKIADEPFLALYAMVAFILRKDLSANVLHISIFTALRPVLALFSFYWSANLAQSRWRLVPSLMQSYLLARLPFLALPFCHSPWGVIIAAGFYQLFHRASIPPLLELLKTHLHRKELNRIYSLGFVIAFAETTLFGLIIGKTLDCNPFVWKLLFAPAAMLSLTTLFFYRKIPSFPKSYPRSPKSALPQRLIQPWKETFSLIKTRRDFAQFQLGFMIGGSGLMLITPALTFFYADTLNLTHMDISVARYLWMGCGVLSSTWLWKRKMDYPYINRLTSYILIGFTLFPLFVLLAIKSLIYLNIAFFVYGIAQAGSHLLWNLSGPLFAQNEESSRYSNANILMIGLRGLIAPVLGGVLMKAIGPRPTLYVGISLFLTGLPAMAMNRRPKFAKQ